MPIIMAYNAVLDVAQNDTEVKQMNSDFSRNGHSSFDIWLSNHAVKIVVSTAAFIVVIWIAFLLVIVFNGVFNKAGDSFGVVTSLFSGLSLFGVIAALLIQRKDLLVSLKEMHNSSQALQQQALLAKHERKENVRQFASTFHSERLKTARDTAYVLRKPFFSDASFRVYLAGQWIDLESTTPRADVIPLDKQEDKNDNRAYTWGLSDIIEYYSVLYHHCISFGASDANELARLFSDRYIWSYWRGMLLIHGYNVAILYNKMINEDSKIADQFTRPGWIEDLYFFDKLSGMKPYEPGIHPRETCYSNDVIEFDENFLVTERAWSTSTSFHLDKISGVSSKMAQNLRASGVNTIYQLANADVRALARRMNSRHATQKQVQGWVDEANKICRSG